MSTSTSSSSHQPRDDRHPHHPDGPRVSGGGDVFVLPADDIRVLDVHDRGSRAHPTVQRVTAARGSHSDDVGRRMRTYALSMGVRTLCVLAVVLSFPHWWAWLFVPGAVVLPYVAVVLANVGGERVQRAPAVPSTGSSVPALRAPGGG